MDAPILSLETSGSVGSIAIHAEGRCLATQIVYTANSHAETLGKSIDHLLDITGLKAQNLGAIALSEGPGSFTGLRIGTSTAKGLCYGLDIPLLPVRTHDAMAQSILGWCTPKSIIIPMQDARRMEVYTTVYQVTEAEKQFSILSPTHNLILDQDSYAAYLEQDVQVYFIGDGCAKWQSILTQNEGIKASFIFKSDLTPLAQYIGDLATSHYQQLDKVTGKALAYYTPFYLKPWVGNQTTPKNQVL